ncbi:PREDICTED: uncharacterized protein LOC108758203 [Trachymyrmex cornetzi]|uniref:uncharacterized protein LOC108758203 n=1 Tax=Trachymyrmex cornetzi TaxID=471704 RepID=UPI00084F0D83|nr:PREDICTED: uncharacterized protein LOC108758203 [Trachymyrmex cornetzi]
MVRLGLGYYTPVAEPVPWTKVLGRKEARRTRTAARRGESATKSIPPKGGGVQAKPVKKVDKRQAPGPKGRSPRLRPMKAVAITVTAPPGSLAEAMTVVRQNLDLAEMQIDDLQARRAVTGALILEVKGPENQAKANKLAKRMAEVLASQEGVKVSRPIKRAEIRVAGLDDSVTPTDR